MNRKGIHFSILFSLLTISLTAQVVNKPAPKKEEPVYEILKQYKGKRASAYKYNPKDQKVIRLGQVQTSPKDSINTTTKETIKDSNLKSEPTSEIAKKESSKITQKPQVNYIVKKGDTKYSLSRKFRVSVAALEQMNPNIVPVLIVGDSIKVKNPTNKAAEKLDTKNIAEKTPQTITGKTSEKTTQKSVTEKPIAEKTPQTITNKNAVEKPVTEKPVTEKPVTEKPVTEKPIAEKAVEPKTPKAEDKISEKQVIEKTLPKEEVLVPAKVSSEDYVDYTVQPKETLYGLSKKAKMSSNKFLKLNPELKNGVVVGMVIKMPKKSVKQTAIHQTSKPIENALEPKVQKQEDKTAEKQIVVEPVLPKESIKQTAIAPEGKSVAKPVIPTNGNLSATLLKNIEKTIYFIMPYSEVELKAHNNTSPIDETLKDQADFLKGVQMAIETAKSQGVKLKVQFLKSKEVEAKKSLQDKIKQEAAAIILTSNRSEDIILIKEYSGYEIPVIIPQQNWDSLNSENIFNALPTTESERKKMLEYLKKENGHVIVVQDGGAIDLKEEISKYCPNANYITAAENGEINTEELQKSLSAKETNFVIMNTTKSGLVLTSTTASLSQINNHKVHLVILENSKIPSNQKISSNRLRALKMIYPSADIVSPESTKFIEGYTQKNHQKPSNQLLKGYDITLDTILRLFQTQTFKELAETIDTEQLTTKFDYQKNEYGSYSNSGININQLDENGAVKILK